MTVIGNPVESIGLRGGEKSTAVLDALGDAVSREILVAAAGGAVTVEQLADACGVSESTVYRRLDRLNDLGLVERSNPLNADARGSYRTTMRGLYVAVGEGGIAVQTDEGNSLADAMKLVLDIIDLRRMTYDRDEGTVDLSISLDDGDLETFLRLYADIA